MNFLQHENPSRPRHVLAEIDPEQQHVRITAVTPTTPALHMHNHNILLTPVSPDELVIRQRGPRTPNKSNMYANLIGGSPLRTPKKDSGASGIRSSPRKRVIDMNLNSPIRDSPDKRNRSIVTPMKRIKIEEKSINTISEESLPNLLKAYSNQQLISIIQDLCVSNPALEARVRDNLQVPDIKPLEEKLIELKKNINKSLPASRTVSKSDSPAFVRARPHFLVFKKTIMEQCKSLATTKHWDALLDYVISTWSVVNATPKFDNAAHNINRQACFKILCQYAITALKNGSTKLGEQRIDNFARKIVLMKTDYDDIMGAYLHLEELINNKQ